MINVYNILPEGEENALSRSTLAAMLGLSDRELRREIATERLHRALILSTQKRGGGYFRAANLDELRRWVKSMEARGRATFAVVSAARRVLRDKGAE